MRLDTKPNDVVIFIGEGGYPIQREQAHAKLTVGQEYTVENLYVGTWDSVVTLVGIDGTFNSVLFDNMESGK
jgi:hypothetical protein